MKATFEFDGESLRIHLVVEDSTERAVAQLMERFSAATVRIDYGESSMYHYSDRSYPKAVDITLRVPPEKEPEF